jgi:hypothetical protein
MLDRVIDQQIHNQRLANGIAARLGSGMGADVRGQAQQQARRGLGQVEGYAHGFYSYSESVAVYQT